MKKSSIKADLDDSKRIRVAIVGQPNVGKSSLFNVLVKGHAHVANWPGTTVEVHRGVVTYRGYVIEVTDLPGIYGVKSVTLDEEIACKNILVCDYDVYIVLVDSTAPERTIGLAIELLELMKKVIVVFTKIDESHRAGIHINYEGLSRELEVPVIPVSAKTEFGVRELFDKIIEVAFSKNLSKQALNVDYIELNGFITEVVKLLEINGFNSNERLYSRGVAIKFLEGEKTVDDLLKRLVNPADWERLTAIREKANVLVDGDLLGTIRFYRKSYSLSLAKRYVVRVKIPMDKSEDLDKLLYNPVIGSLLGALIYLSILILVFTVNTGFPLTTLLRLAGVERSASFIERLTIVNMIESLLEYVSGTIGDLMGNNILAHFFAEAVVIGLGTVLLFTPLILTVSIASAMLEDSGIAPRLAVSLHSILSRFGLSGHATLPIILGFGCNVPSILSTRTLVNSYERFRLLLTLGFIPCQARLIVLLATASSIGSPHGLAIVALSYSISILLFMGINRILLRISMLRGEVYLPDILMEIPPLHKPLIKVIWWNAWSNTKHFLVKAGVVIFAVSVINWFLINYSPSLKLVEDPGESVGAQIAKAFSPLLKPLGISGESSWIPSLALITGFVAKEMYLVTLLSSTRAVDLSDVFPSIGLGLPEIYALTVVVTLYMPCLATIAAIYGESRSFKATLIAVALSLVTAYVAGIITYTIFRIML